MKRDMDTVRTLLQEIEAKDDPYVYAGALGDGLDGVWGHLKLMEDDRLVEFSSASVDVNGKQMTTLNRSIRMTSRGHDFLEGTRTPARWKGVKDTLTKSGIALTVEAILYYIKSQIVGVE